MDETIKSRFLAVYEKAKVKIGDEIKTWNKASQFSIDGDEFYVEFKDGELVISEGKHSRPTATLIMSKEVLEQLLEGKLDAMTAFLRGKMKITGNVLDTAMLRKMLEAVRA